MRHDKKKGWSHHIDQISERPTNKKAEAIKAIMWMNSTTNRTCVQKQAVLYWRNDELGMLKRQQSRRRRAICVPYFGSPPFFLAQISQIVVRRNSKTGLYHNWWTMIDRQQIAQLCIHAQLQQQQENTTSWAPSTATWMAEDQRENNKKDEQQ